VLALTDEALLRIAVGATRVPRRQRAQLLKDIAACAEGRPPSLAASTLRMRKMRARIDAGTVYLGFEVNETDVTTMLVGCGMLASNLADVRSAQAAAVKGLIELLSDASLQADPIFDSVRIGLLRMAQRRRKLRGLSKATRSSSDAK
jgi:hypothetical protein